MAPRRGYSSGLTVSPNANHIFDTARLLENFGLDSGAGEITGMTQHERWESSGSSSGQNSRQETPPALNSTRHSSITGRSPSRYELSPPGLLGDGCTSKDGSRVSKTSLHIAVESGHEHIVQRLLASGRLFVDEPNGEGNTALHLATGAEDLAMCLCLLRYGANANAENAEGWTPVHLAIQAGSLEILDVLVGHNGDLAKRVPEG
ncbi:ankyrin repeat-containing domain protein [Xylariaceae sp. FL1019]|nr:ankyrin repeat-containing domain protein [Xylariaceae sp. FL1019]